MIGTINAMCIDEFVMYIVKFVFIGGRHMAALDCELTFR